MQNKIANDPAGNITDILRKQLLKNIQRSGQPAYNELLYWLFIQEKDFESALIQAKAMDKRMDENGERLMALGILAASNDEYAVAEKCFQQIISKGASGSNYIAAKIEMLKASEKKIIMGKKPTASELSALENNYETAIGEMGKIPLVAPLISSYARLKAFYLNKTSEAIKLLEETINLPGLSPAFKAQCKLDLADILVLTGDVWEAALYYGQVDKDFKNDALGREAKFRNARLSYYLGEFDWAAAQLNVLKSATSQLISNDAMSLALLIMDNTGMDSITAPLLIYSRADLLSFQNKDEAAMLVLDSLLTVFPGHSLTDEAWYRKASLFEKKGMYDTAAFFLNEIVIKYPNDILSDDALIKLAGIYENNLNDPRKAMELYEKLLVSYPGSLFAVDARKKFRLLRGDKVN